jgi:hypothetical protein
VCGLEFDAPRGRIPEQVPGALQRLSSEAALLHRLRTMPSAAACHWAGPDTEKLRQVQMARNYKPEWVQYEYQRQLLRQSRSGGDQ